MKRKNLYFITLLIFAVVTIIIVTFKMGATEGDNRVTSFDNSNNKIAIMVWDEATGGYVEQDSFPAGKYMINTANSSCVTNGLVSGYDYMNGTVKINPIRSSDCNLFFEKMANKINYSYLYRETLQANLKECDGCTYRILIEEKDGDYSNTFTGSVDNNAIELYFDEYLTACNIYNYRIIIEDSNGFVVSDENDSQYAEYWCFVAGTKVYTPNDYKNIEDIIVGDLVYTYNLSNNSVELHSVEKLITSKTFIIIEVTTEGGDVIKMSNRHQIYVKDKGWIRAYDLGINDVLVDSNNGDIKIKNIKTIYYDNPIDVYNMTIEGTHNYYVSDGRILVHNAVSAPCDLM